MLLLYNNLARGATVTASSSAAGYPASNLALAARSSAWRSAAGVLTSVTVTVDHGASVNRLAYVLDGVNFQDGATMRVQTSTVSNFSTTTYDTSATPIACFDTSLSPLLDDAPPWGRPVIHVAPSVVAGRYDRWTLNDSGNPDNHLRARVAFISLGLTGSFKDSWLMADAFAGEPGLEAVLRRHDVEVTNLTEAASRSLVSIVRSHKRSGRMYMLPREDSAPAWLQEAIYCRAVAGISRQRTGAVPPQWTIRLDLLEIED